ncbi:3-hydroxyisobutyrate dehydrogenase [Sinorhizobium fredii]|uniref:3-hydroxyisobutyrate dehydrogenase n=2 Tax=Rhizobium fredii TaxID=380 RepID=A0A2A6LVY1_RHIFR|nr:3-hydroxyisobutyrate dehydrogenase [Sinorhizobium fredii]
MGLPMAFHLASSGCVVRGFDINEIARSRFTEAGGESCVTAVEAASGATVIVLMVVNIKQAYEVLFDAAALSSSVEDCIVILMSTCPPGDVEALAKSVHATGRRFLDAPVSGGVAGALKASLSIMVAGEKQAFDQCHEFFNVLGSKVYYLGEQPGNASVAKAVNQLLCGVHLAAAAEALSLAERAGLDTETVLEIVSGSAAASWMLTDRGKRMLDTDPEVTSAVDIFVKDLGIVLSAGSSAKAALPLASIAHQFFLATSGQGAGAADDSQVIRAYRRMSSGNREE